MEVHHHPHVEKKGFKEYFLEFIMIFLAVSLGFFAEGLRETIKDHKKAHEYIQSFYEDLKADTAKISEVVHFDDEKLKVLNNVSSCYDTVSENPDSASCLFSIVKSTLSNMPFQITERTLQQLATADGFRILQKEDADSIVKYVQGFNYIRDFQSTGYQQAQDDVRQMAGAVMNVKANLQLFNPHLEGEFLYSHDKALLNKYFNDLIRYQGFTHAQRKILKQFENDQMQMLRYFRNKYHFE